MLLRMDLELQNWIQNKMDKDEEIAELKQKLLLYEACMAENKIFRKDYDKWLKEREEPIKKVED